MKKAKNIALLVGLVCHLLVVLWALARFVFDAVGNIDGTNWLWYCFVSYVMPALTVSLLGVLPLVLLVRNLKNKTGNALPIVTLTVNGILLLGTLFFSFASLISSVPQYIIYSQLGLIDSYITVTISFLSNNVCLVSGFAFLFVGSVLSLSNKQRTTNQETTRREY